MVGTLFGPFGHLAFDHAGIDAVTAWFGAFSRKFPKQPFAPLLKRLGGSRITFRQAALQDLETAREREAIGIKIRELGGLEHQGTDHKMPQRQRI